MTYPEGINPEYYTLLDRSEELIAAVKLVRESEPVDWKEIHRLNKEISRSADEMRAMLSQFSETSSYV